LKRALAQGAQVYWVCPLIESTDKSELAAAEERHAHLQQIFGDRVGLLHGGLGAAAKDATMSAFAERHLSVLVATTVIEVGVDVPNASIMVIEHSERFGLAQLHQLRGRVGRGSRQSYCVLLYKPPLGETARARLEMLRATEDGFLIAEKDLELRGGGEVLGARQSGMPEFRVAEVPNFPELLSAARDDARMVLAADPRLLGERGLALRNLLYLFECDEAVRLFRAAKSHQTPEACDVCVMKTRYVFGVFDESHAGSPRSDAPAAHSREDDESMASLHHDVGRRVAALRPHGGLPSRERVRHR
jgi:ATP-dependent DNA helicase RecG